MGLHLVEVGRERAIRKFVHTGTVCAYPKMATVPFEEGAVWDGFPEETNAPYGIAKKMLFAMLEGYAAEYGLRSAVVIPVNLYGPNDNFDVGSSHVIPALIRKFFEARASGAKSATCWGTGSASREFLYVDDAAEGILCAAERMEDPLPLNLGTGVEITIKLLAETVADLCGFRGEILWDASKPDGQPRRCLSTRRASEQMGWSAETSFEVGIAKTIRWFEKNHESLREITYGDTDRSA